MGRYVASAYWGHDASVAVVGEGRIAHLEYERRTRRRHEDRMPREATLALLTEALGLVGGDLDEVAAVVEVGCGDQLEGRRSRVWGADLATWDSARTTYLGPEIPCHYVPHHLAHAAYALYASPLEAARVVAVDGGGDAWLSPAGEVAVTAAAGDARHAFGSADSTWSLRVADGGGLGARWTGLAVDCCADPHAAGTVMAMAGVPRSRFEAACGAPVEVLDRIRALQRDTDRHLADLVGGDAVAACLGGGVALNGVAVGALSQRGRRRVCVPPAANDGGLTVGAALFGLHAILRAPRPRYSDRKSVV